MTHKRYERITLYRKEDQADRHPAGNAARRARRSAMKSTVRKKAEAKDDFGLRLLMWIIAFFVFTMAIRVVKADAESGSSTTTYSKEVLPRRATYEERLDEEMIPYGINARDVLWVARTLTSESGRHREQRLVMWTIRNRRDAKYRGDSTYTEVVLSPSQYSVWRSDRNTEGKRREIMALNFQTENAAWQETLALTINIMKADASLNPIPGIKHFYSPISMPVRHPEPVWAKGKVPEIVVPGVRKDRFRFYASID